MCYQMLYEKENQWVRGEHKGLKKSLYKIMTNSDTDSEESKEIMIIALHQRMKLYYS